MSQHIEARFDYGCVHLQKAGISGQLLAEPVEQAVGVQKGDGVSAVDPVRVEAHGHVETKAALLVLLRDFNLVQDRLDVLWSRPHQRKEKNIKK
jgi:hypothetical protein